MKQYAVFAGMDYYPFGGWDDLLGTYESLIEASKYAEDHVKQGKWRWAHIVNLQTGAKVDFP